MILGFETMQADRPCRAGDPPFGSRKYYNCPVQTVSLQARLPVPASVRAEVDVQASLAASSGSRSTHADDDGENILSSSTRSSTA